MDIDEARQIAGEMNRHHFHYYYSGMVTYKKKYIHLYKRKGILPDEDIPDELLDKYNNNKFKN